MQSTNSSHDQLSPTLIVALRSHASSENGIVIKISVITIICSFVYTGVKIIFTCIKTVAHPQLFGYIYLEF